MRIDYDAIAKGWIDLLDDNEQAVLAFGMIPHDKFQILIRELYKSLAEKWVRDPRSVVHGMKVDKVIECLKPKFKQEVEHQMSLAIYRNARMVV